MNTTSIKFISICSLLFTLLSCEKEDKELTMELIGTWTVEEVARYPNPDIILVFNKGDKLILNADNSFNLQGMNGTWHVTRFPGSSPTLKLEFIGNPPLIADIDHSGDRLTLKFYKEIPSTEQSSRKRIQLLDVMLKRIK
ncbi:hypothetical protein ACGE0T_01905 [Parabacteroides sp. APC149_11_2_Y6]